MKAEILVLYLVSFLFILDLYGGNDDTQGLRMAEYKKLGFLVQQTGTEEMDTELNMDRLHITSKMRLQRAGITPLEKDSAEAYLQINVEVDEQAYYVQLQFCRDVTFVLQNGDTYHMTGITWSKTSAGTSMYGLGPIMLIVDDLLKLFVDLYLQTNE